MIRLLDNVNINWNLITSKHIALFKDSCMKNLLEITGLNSLEQELNTYLLSKVADDTLLIGEPDELRKIRERYLILKNKGLSFTVNKVSKTKKGKDKTTKEYSDYYYKLENAFDYESFSGNYQSSGKWGAYEFIHELGVKSCLYCNRSYSITFDRAYEYNRPGMKGKVRPALDHVFLQNRYPFFRISIFNLVPSCTDCNSGLKGSHINEKIEDHLNPYSENMHDLYMFSDKFSNSINDKKIDWDLFDEYSFSVAFRPRDQSKRIRELHLRADINSNLFAIEELYNCHKEELCRIIVFANVYGFGRINDLTEKVENLPLSIENLKKFTFGNVINDIQEIRRSPFAKFKYDIAKKYKII